jgi:hypothetical protein
LHVGKVWVAGEELDAIRGFIAPDQNVRIFAHLWHVDISKLYEEASLLASIELAVLGSCAKRAIGCGGDGIVREAEEEWRSRFDDGFKGA